MEEEPDHPFTEPKPLSAEAALAESRAYFDRWFESASRYLQTGLEHTERGWSNEAAFELHQAAERYYHCTLLVRSLYSPKTHNLNRLRALCEGLEPRLVGVWPGKTKVERRGYELLRTAYVNARYSPEYRITYEQLKWLIGRVEELKITVQVICRERFDQLERHGRDASNAASPGDLPSI